MIFRGPYLRYQAFANPDSSDAVREVLQIRQIPALRYHTYANVSVRPTQVTRMGERLHFVRNGSHNDRVNNRNQPSKPTEGALCEDSLTQRPLRRQESVMQTNPTATV